MTREAPFVSVVVVTFGRLDSLLDTLNDLSRQDYPGYDITVVDQNPTTFREVAELAAQSNGLIRIPRLDQPNMCAARNVGIDKTQGEIVLYVDDDIRSGGHLIREHAAAYVAADIGGVGGWIEADRPDKVWKPSETSVRRPIGCNMSFRREVLKRVGGFDTHIAGPASFGDEVDIAYRIRKAGYRIAVAPKAILAHLAVPSGGCRPEDGRPREYWRSYIRNQVLVYLKTHSLPYRMALPFWLVRFGRTVQQLSGGLLKQDEFAQAASEGVTAYNQSRRVRSYLANSGD
jgi:GT2 family glycosyltransferase